MEVIVGIMIALSIFGLNKKGRDKKAQKRLEDQSAKNADQATAEHQRKLQETDEHITVVLPIVRDK